MRIRHCPATVKDDADLCRWEDQCAANMADHIEKRLSEIATAASRYSSRPRAMLYDLSGYTAGANTLIDEMLRRADARNVAAEHGIHGSTRISAETIALWQPDFIIAGARTTNSTK